MRLDPIDCRKCHHCRCRRGDPAWTVVDALLDRGLAVYAINPKQLDRLLIASAFLVPRTIGETPTSRLMGCAPIGICFAVCKSLIRASSSCVSGHGLPK